MVLFAGRSICQVFHFEDEHTVIIKNTLQSPAHWYLEITNDCGQDTTLRWVAEFQSIPDQWVINFDAQNQSWSVVEDGDSSDFVLMVAPELPQKLIIGAMLNNTPGHGSVFFHIFDPNNRTMVQTIEYEFIISQAGLDELSNSRLVELRNDFLQVSNDKTTRFQVVDELGALLLDVTTAKGIALDKLPVQIPLIIVVTQENRQVVFRVIR